MVKIETLTTLGKESNTGSRTLVPFYNEDSFSQLKRAAFLFDKVALAFYTTRSRAKRARFPLTGAFIPDAKIRSRVLAELDWLYDQKILDAPEEDPLLDMDALHGFVQDKPVWSIRVSNQWRAMQWPHSSFSTQEALEQPFFNDTGPVFLAKDKSKNKIYTNPQNRQLVAEVVISQIPEPAEGTPWEAILDWRNDEETRVKLRRLKHWMNKASQLENLKVSHLQDEVLYLIDDYRQAMKVHSFQTRTGTLRSLVTTSAAVLENIAKLKFEKLADLPFQLLGHKIKRSKADLEAPGRELAYIVDVQNKFG